jgi:hypothetical protein
MATRHIPKWLVQKFDAYRDENARGGYSVKPDRPTVGIVRIPDGLSDAKMLNVLKRAGLIEVGPHVHLDWISGDYFNILDGDEPLYQVQRRFTHSEMREISRRARESY